MSIFQYRDRACDSSWPLRVSRAGIFHATRIVKNDHRGCKLTLERIFGYDYAKRPENCRRGAGLQRSSSDRAKQFPTVQAETQGSCETTEVVTHASLVEIDRLLRNARADTREPAARSSLISQRSGRGPRLFDRNAMSNVPASRRNKSGPRNNQRRDYNTADRQPRP